MNDRAFEILGIAPTEDGRAIRDAFLRLARIYHPDRFAGMPDDVRAEAERRMKDAAVAYEQLREFRTKPPADDGPSIDFSELRERAMQYKETIEKKQSEEKRNRAKWRRWDELEKEARARADFEAEIAAAIARDFNGTYPPPPSGTAKGSTTRSTSKNGNGSSNGNGNGNGNGSEHRKPEPSQLAQRLDAARRGETSPLVPKPRATED